MGRDANGQLKFFDGKVYKGPLGCVLGAVVIGGVDEHTLSQRIELNRQLLKAPLITEPFEGWLFFVRHKVDRSAPVTFVELRREGVPLRPR